MVFEDKVEIIFGLKGAEIKRNKKEVQLHSSPNIVRVIKS
jgi:hypothetical protein